MFQQSEETLNREELRQLQSNRLKKTVKRVYERVPFYRKQLEDRGIHPDTFRGVEQLELLPFTRKADLRETYPFGLFSVPTGDCLRLHASSGTKGKPTVVGYTRTDLQSWAEVCARAIVTAGGKRGDVFHNAYGYGLFTGGLGMHAGAEMAGVTVVPASGGNRSRQITLIEDFQPRGIAGTPSFILSLAETMEQMGKDPRSTSLEYGIFGAEPWSEEMRKALEERWGIDALDIYGLSEVVGPGVAIECREEKNGLHIAEDHFLAEVVDPSTGEPLPDGEEGELVFTSLTKEAIPLLRYRTGDIASLDRKPCPCGRTHARMSRIKGRLDDMLIIRGVNMFPSEAERLVLAQKELAPHYQLVVERVGMLDKLTVEVEMSQDSDRLSAQQLSGRLRELFKEGLGVTVEVILHPSKTLPRSEGKAVRVIDRRGEVKI
ncbi:phenylacetate-coenzyme A ligase [Marinithermofilum abyssi]|uniref:Phenylacetate-coenzyme A ligase n=1 Tax=Marinithermofilum abyssi TaxID=1571185 RepID=A0A8J2VJW5_9BACL|nr:phenylacetate--CoA ligase [Marinithermofilum abyssi]GGE25939.1 phenylacetate-coenzyme A ligase [Marinithermofilum abyssi]